MAIKSILTSQTDFTGEFPVSENTLALWRFNEAAPDSDTKLADASGHGRHAFDEVVRAYLRRDGVASAVGGQGGGVYRRFHQN